MKEREREERGSFEEPRKNSFPWPPMVASDSVGLRAEQLVPMEAHCRDELGGGGGTKNGGKLQAGEVA